MVHPASGPQRTADTRLDMEVHKNLNFFEYIFIVRDDWIKSSKPYIEKEVERNWMQRRAV